MLCLLTAVTSKGPRDSLGTVGSVDWQQWSWSPCNCTVADLPPRAPGSASSQDIKWSCYRQWGQVI